MMLPHGLMAVPWGLSSGSSAVREDTCQERGMGRREDVMSSVVPCTCQEERGEEGTEEGEERRDRRRDEVTQTQRTEGWTKWSSGRLESLLRLAHWQTERPWPSG